MPAVLRARSRAPISPTSRHAPNATATCSSSTARRSGPRSRKSRKFGILIARTDPDTSKYTGISYFIIADGPPRHRDQTVAQHGRDVRRGPVQRGLLHRCPCAGREPHRVAQRRVGDGEEDAGQRARVVVDAKDCSGDYGPTVRDLLELVRKRGGATDPVLRQQLVDVYIEGEIMRYHQLRRSRRR